MKNRYLNSLSKCEITHAVCDNESCVVEIRWRGNTYRDASLCHTDDMEFFSRKVGYNIAFMRAQLRALQDFLEDTKIRLSVILDIKTIASVSMKSNTVDAVSFLDEMRHKEELRLARIQYAIKSKKKELRDYLNAQADFIEAIKKQREEREQRNKHE